MLMGCAQKIVKLFFDARKLFVHFPNPAHGKLHMLFADLFKGCIHYSFKRSFFGINYRLIFKRHTLLCYQRDIFAVI